MEHHVFLRPEIRGAVTAYGCRAASAPVKCSLMAGGGDMANGARDPIIIAGHSHTMAFGMPWNEPEGAFDLIALPNSNFVGMVGGWPRSKAYWDYLIHASAGRLVGICWGGNQHTGIFLLAHEPDVDFLLPGDDAGTPDVGTVVVPAKLVSGAFRLSFETLQPLLQRFKDAGAEPFLIGTPPPRGDEEYLRKLFDEKDKWFDGFSNLVGIDLKTAKLVPARRRYKAWVLLQALKQEVAYQHGLRFIAPPTEASDQNGYLKPEYCGDLTHGNRAYGKLMLDHIWEELSKPSITVDQPHSETAEPAHPYKRLSDRNFWSRAFSEALPIDIMKVTDLPLIKFGEKIASAGSCFASNIIPHIERSGFTYLRTEQRHPMFCKAQPERFGYDAFSAAHGNIYTARQLLQLLRRSRGVFQPIEDRWDTSFGVVDPFRPGLRYHASSHQEFDLLTQQHLNACLRAFTEADVFIFTLGLTEAWVSRQDGAVFPACPGTVGGEFDPKKHEFRNFSGWEITSDLRQFVDELRLFNPDVRIILTVSPVPLVATATDRHVLRASTYSKSVLLVAAETVCAERPGVTYFPAYEIVTGPHAPADFFQEDRRNVAPAAIEVVMQAFLSCCETGHPPQERSEGTREKAIELFSARFADAECEELMADRRSV